MFCLMDCHVLQYQCRFGKGRASDGQRMMTIACLDGVNSIVKQVNLGAEGQVRFG